MSTLTRWVLAHKRVVVGFWVAATLAGIMAAGPASDALDQKFSVPAKEGWETNVAIAEHYRDTGGDTAPVLPVVTLPEGKTVDSPGVRPELAGVDQRLERAVPNARIASYASTGDRTFISDDGRTTFAVVYPPADPDAQFGENAKAEKAASAALEGATVAGAPVHLTGFDALAEDSGAGGDGPGVLLEALLGGAGALIVLAFVFASFLAVVPIVMAVSSIMTTFLLLLGSPSSPTSRRWSSS
jgi:RND superfamily putative drug exporter